MENKWCVIKFQNNKQNLTPMLTNALQFESNDSTARLRAHIYCEAIINKNGMCVSTYNAFNFFCNDIKVQNSLSTDHLLFKVDIPYQVHMTVDNIFCWVLFMGYFFYLRL